MNRTNTIRISAELKELDVLRRFVEERAQALGLEAPALYDVLVAVEEMTTNIIIHGYRGQPGAIEIELRALDDTLEIYLRDQAPPFDPAQAPKPDTTSPLELRQPGGLGIHLVRHFMDALIHRVPAQGGNELILVKKGVLGKSRLEPSPAPHE
jgi:serine/threonine-protein kinase RsbW